MNPVRLARIEEVYHAVLEIDPEERSIFLASACGGDTDLRREVESLVSYAGAASSLIDRPPIDVAADMFAQRTRASIVDTRIGRYEIVESIGTGGMGEVFLAKDIDLERKVAIKIIDPAFAHDADRLQRFLNEAKTASALNHPNILVVYEIGTVENAQFIATEFIDGETLGARMRRELPDLKTAWDIAVQIASALRAAHESGIVHRDIKPENVMIRPDGLVKVLDFGLAKPLLAPRLRDEAVAGSIPAFASTTMDSRFTSPGMILGTANYMSPEQARGETVDARSDIFSFGILLCELVTGTRPFADGSAAEVMQAFIHQEPTPLTELSPDLPPEIAQIIKQTLRKDPDERYQTMTGLLIDLKAAAQVLGLQNDGNQSTVRPGGATAAPWKQGNGKQGSADNLQRGVFGRATQAA